MAKTEVKTMVDVRPWQVILAAWVILFCLALIFAREFNSWAVAAEDSPTRTVALPITGAVLAVAEGIGIAGVKESVEDTVHPVYDRPLIVGANLDTQVAVTPAVPPATGNTVAVAEREAKPVERTAAALAQRPRPTRVLIIGDSTIEAGLGTDLERRLEEFSGVTVMRFGKHSTGLARPDYFNWEEKLAELLTEFNPDLILAYFGDNDCQGLSNLEGAFVTKFGTDDWDKIYGERVTAVVKLMQSGGATAVMIGMPIMRSKSFSNKVERLNKVAEAATSAAGGIFLPTWGMTSDADGKYISSVEYDGKTRMIRAGDGIHFSSHGSAYAADQLIIMLKEHFTLELPAK